MATNPKNNNNIFAPPTDEEMFTPPRPEEMQQSASQSELFAPPTAEEFAPPTPEELGTEGPSGTILQADLQSLQKKYQLTPDQLDILKREIPAMGAQIEGEDPALLKRAIGFVGRAAGVQELASKLSREGLFGVGREDENVIKALEEVQDIVRERRSGWETGAEIAAGIALPVGTAIKGVTGGALLGAGIGAAAGYGGAKEGEEAVSTAVGAGLGAGLGFAGNVLGRALSKEAPHLESLPGKQAELYNKMDEATKELEPWKVRTAEIINSEDTLAAVLEKTTNKQTARELLLEAEGRNEFSDDVIKDILRQFKKNKREASDENLFYALAHKKVIRDLNEVADYLEANGDINKMVSKKRTENELFDVLAEQRRQGPQRIAQALDELAASKAAQKAIASDVDVLTRRQPGAAAQAAKSILDGRIRLGLIDDRLLTSLEVAADQSARDMNKFTNVLHKVALSAKNIDTQIRNAGIADRAQLFDVINNPKAVIPEQWKPIVESYKQATDELANMLNSKLGTKVLNPMADQRYALNTVVELPEFIRRLNQKLTAIKQKVGIDPLASQEVTRAKWNQIKELPEYDEFRRAVELFGRPASDPDSFLISGRMAMSPASLRENFDLVATSLLKREGKIPDFILEKDPAKLLILWAERNIRPAYLSPFVSELRKARNIALKANDKDAIQYLTNLINDLTGVRKGTIASSTGDAILNLRAKALMKADQMPEGSIRRAAYELAANAPDIIPFFTNQVYPNFLGWSPKAIVGNLTTPVTMMMPELKSAYGNRLVLQSMAELAPSLPKILSGKMRKELLEQGLVGRQYSTELAALKAGINKGSLYRATENLMEKQAAFAMWAFEKSEEVNRALAASVGKKLAAGIVKKDQGALGVLNRMSPAYRRAIEAAKGNEEEITKLMQNFIAGKTLFNYNRQTMSEFGRTMGPMLSVFTKWPSSIAGDIYRTLQQKGTIKGGGDLAVRYLGPLASLIMVQQMLPEDVTESERFKAIFGKEGLSSSSPILTVKSIAEGEFFAPPVVSAGKDLATGILTGDPSKVWKWFNDSLAAFTPGAWLGRILGRDIYRLQNEEAPEGTYIQKLFPNSDIDAIFKSE